MNNFTRLRVWLQRMGHSRGFGIQSPTDYQFVCYVVNEHWPYYAYSQLGAGQDWLQKKMGRLYLRLANWRQPATIVDMVGAADYLHAGCRKAVIVAQQDGGTVEMACLPIEGDYESIFRQCADGSVVVLQDLWKRPDRWLDVQRQAGNAICYDLYYCGIVIFDSHREQQSYIVNF